VGRGLDSFLAGENNDPRSYTMVVLIGTRHDGKAPSQTVARCCNSEA
jgi:hypothetical protein